MSHVFSATGLVLFLVLVGVVPGCATTSSPPVASAVGGAEDLSGDWTGHGVIDLAEGVQMHMRGTRQLKRTSANNYDEEATFALTLTIGGSDLPIGKLTLAATVKNDLREECETITAVAYERPEPLSMPEIEATGIPVENYEALLNELAATATVEELNNDSTCDKVFSHSKDEMVLEGKDGDKMTYQRTR